MTFLLKWSIKTENRPECLKRWANSNVEDEVPEGVKLVGRWHDLNNWSGCAILEADDTATVVGWTLLWSDLCDLTVSPVLDDESSKDVARTFLSAQSST